MATVITPAMRPYQPFGAAKALFYCRDEEVVLSCPAGTGKSIGCLTKLYACAEQWPGMRALIVRKTRESLTESALVTFEGKVVPEGHPILRGPQRRMRQAYHFPNGSEIVVGGIDKPQKIMSTDYDLIYVMEAIELVENDWESLTTRLRHGVMPFQQIIADTNPDRDQHWLNQRHHKGLTTFLESRHQDNPMLWDSARGDWTAKGRAYIGKLDRLTGVRRARLRDGIWAAAEGLVYDDFDPAIHVIPAVPIPPTWPRYWVIDFGYTNPFVWQAWAVDPDGRAYLYREIYQTQRLVRDHAARIRELTQGEPWPAAIICDHDAEDRATLAAAGMRNQPAMKAVSVGIQAVQQRLRLAGDGKPRLFILAGALVEADGSLQEAALPFSTEQEFGSYAWAKAADGKPNKEEPTKAYDHGMDAARYFVMHLDGKPRVSVQGAVGGQRTTIKPPPYAQAQPAIRPARSY